MNRTKLFLVISLLAVGIFIGYKQFQSNASMEGSSGVSKHRKLTSAEKQKVDDIFAKVDWDYHKSRDISRRPSANDTVELKELRAKYKGIQEELNALEPRYYPAVIMYVNHFDRAKANLATQFVYGIREKSIEPLMVLLCDTKVTGKTKRSYTRLLSSAARDNQPMLLDYLSSSVANERLVASEILGERASDIMRRGRRYGYRISHSSHSRSRDLPFPLSLRPRMFELFKSEQVPEIKANIARMIGTYGEDNEEIKDELISCFKEEKDVQVKLALAEVLGYLACKETVSGAKGTLEPLTESLDTSKNNQFRHAILVELERCASKLNSDSIKVLERLTEDSVESISLEALDALTKASQYRDDCVPFVLKSLKSDNRDTVLSALKQYPKMKSGIDQVLPYVFLLGKKKEFERYVYRSFGDLPGPYQDKSIPYLKEVLKSGSQNRREALSALDKMGLRAKPALPEIKKIANGKNNSLKHTAARMVQRIESY